MDEQERRMKWRVGAPWREKRKKEGVDVGGGSTGEEVEGE